MQQNGTQAGVKSKDPYLKQKIMSASPTQLVAYMYDAILAACRSEDLDRSQRGLLALIEALDFTHEAIAVPMFQVYQYCMEQVRKGGFSEVEELISGLKTAWSEAMNLN